MSLRRGKQMTCKVSVVARIEWQDFNTYPSKPTLKSRFYYYPYGPYIIENQKRVKLLSLIEAG